MTRFGALAQRVRQRTSRRHDERYRRNTIGPSASLGEAVLGGACHISEHVQMMGNVTVGAYSTLGTGTIVHGGSVTIGRYCQLGPYSAIYALNHFYQGVTCYNNRRLFGGELKALAGHEPVVLGHDVWVGHGAIVLPGATIGTGAIIGAGAVVTGDVCAYGVVVGNPARLIKKRFDDELIGWLLRWEWWQRSPGELSPHKDFFRRALSDDRGAALAYLQKAVLT